MNKVNFDAFKRIHASEELIQKALAIPETAEKAPAVIPWYRQSRAIATAASIVLVALAGLSIYFFIGNKKPPIKTVESPQTVTPSVTDSVESTADPTSPSGTPATSASESQKDAADRLRTGSTDQPTNGNGQPPYAISNQPGAEVPIETGGYAPEPTQGEHRGTETPAPAERATGNSVSTEPATEKPAPTVIPTYPIEPQEPTEAEEPTLSPQKKNLASVGMMIPISSYTGSEQIYCRICTNTGTVLGSEDLFDESHRVDFTTGSGYLLLSYSLNNLGEPLPAGNYTLVFYDEKGNDFYVSSIYLSKGSD